MSSPAAAEANGAPHERPSGFWKLVLGSVGVVYGDIGTSPLYAMREALHAAGRDGLVEEEVIGITSMLVWTLILIVTFKYVTLILRADNHGEGGTLSLLALAQRSVGRRTPVLFVLGVLGASLFYGDAAITPAISVLSALEGLELVAPHFDAWIIPVTVGIIFGLFWVQSRGTGRMGILFGPVTVVWFAVMALLGLLHAGDRLAVFHALNPLHASGFVASHGLGALPVMGSVFLAVTGAEALYADMGHFGRGPIRTAWLGLVFPALTLNYLGQGSLVLARPEAVANPFFLMAPPWALLPLVLLATAATIIASQAVISGAFSLTRQAVQLGLLPRLEIRHTSEAQVGQVYLPRVNWSLLAAVLILVLAFRSSSALASAYGIAVTGTIVVTSLLSFTVFRRAWGWPVWAVLAVLLPLLSVELVFLGANLAKLHDGGYVPLVIAAIVGTLVTTWVRGTAIVNAKAHAASLPLDQLVGMLKKSHPARVPGSAVFLTSDPDAAPAALMHNLKHNHVLHERNFVVTVTTATTPSVSDAGRIAIEPLADSFWRVTLTYGYMEVPNVPKALALARRDGIVLEMMSTSYFLSRRSFRASREGGMPFWQDQLFISMTKAATDATSFYRLPSNRVLELGQQLVV
ncbi:MAG TPA: potassium transporter Kup [Amaricoccus sp.]|uniref:potassium transporter Kup n=1 Tax=Amaricoccus sp. TaxID=1872485 RepID=UPI002CFF7447|nr:potassium transporter Kup [Amaricoccus sp.]HRO12445.1 potassium transporter Kup [Amaricoccus sp.]